MVFIRIHDQGTFLIALDKIVFLEDMNGMTFISMIDGTEFRAEESLEEIIEMISGVEDE